VLGRGRNAVAIWQDLVSQHGFTARYASVGHFARLLRGTPTAEAHPVIVPPRVPTPSGAARIRTPDAGN
jgi:hypothetical protein